MVVLYCVVLYGVLKEKEKEKSRSRMSLGWDGGVKLLIRSRVWDATRYLCLYLYLYL